MKTIVYGSILLCLIITSAALAADDWSQRFPSRSPSWRSAHAMAYIYPGQVLLFGGIDAAGADDETWLYDLGANTWTQMDSVTRPTSMSGHAMAYIGEDQVLLFGGQEMDRFYDETWIYDLSMNTWTQKMPVSHPMAREDHAMAYIGGDRVLLFAGAGELMDDETWVYDLSSNVWTRQTPPSSPSAREAHGVAYIGGDRALLFGGAVGALNDETWIYDLSDNIWTQMNPATSPSAREDHAMAYLGGDQVLLFGGKDEDGSDDETWIYDLSEDIWTQDENSIQPSPRKELGLAGTSMDGSGRLVLFGGVEPGSFDGETWTFGGGDHPVPVEVRSSTVLPNNFSLNQNYPNPFNPVTEIIYAVPRDVHVTVKIFNVLGARVTTLVDADQPAGFYTVGWNAEGLASGVYFCRLKTDEFEKTIKMALVR